MGQENYDLLVAGSVLGLPEEGGVEVLGESYLDCAGISRPTFDAVSAFTPGPAWSYKRPGALHARAAARIWVSEEDCVERGFCDPTPP
jgi:hypothetical protein